MKLSFADSLADFVLSLQASVVVKVVPFLNEKNLNFSHFLILLILRKEQKLTVSEISQRTSYSLSLVSKLIRHLEEKGFVVKIPDKVDSRKVFVILDNLGIEFLLQIKENYIENILENKINLQEELLLYKKILNKKFKS